MTDRPRLFYLDNLRAFAIVMVIVLHAAITYMDYGPAWWYVVDPDRNLYFTMLVLLVDVPTMPALFFIAGFLALPSLERRGIGGFTREKVVRLAIPWVVGVVFLAPLVTYLTYVSRDIPMGYLEFWATEFWGPLFQHGVYWFLGVLFALFLALVAVYAASPRLRTGVPRVEQPRGRLFVAFIALTAGGAILASPAFGVDDWQPIWIVLVVQPARVAFYAGYFALGIYAHQRGWFSATGFRPELGAWGWGCVVAGITYLGFRMSGYPATVPERSIAAILFAIFCLAGVIGGIAVFQRWFDRSGPAWRTLAANSFGIYYVHPLVLYPLAYVLVDLPVSAFVKATILVVVTLLASLAVSALVLKRVPGLRRVF